jgi:class 3 adenylate cyclase
MNPISEPHPAPSHGAVAAWAGGAVAALGSSCLTLLLHGAPFGRKLWQALPQMPQQPVPLPVAFSTALVLGLGAAWVGATVQPLRRVAGLLAAAAILTISQSPVLALHGMAWEPLPALLSLLGAGSIAALLRPAPSGPAQWFRGRIAPKILHQLEATADPVLLRPDQRNATVVTCRLLNENALREVLPASDFLKLCQTFRARASRVLLDHGACLDPTESSGVRAFFGLPLPRPAAADEAVAAALVLDDAMRDFARNHTSAAGAPTCGIGIATGKLTAGLVGHSYSVLGDAVELSRWLAAETSNYEVRLLTDHATHLTADRIEDRPLEFVNPPSGAAVEIFHLLGTLGSLSGEALARRQAFRDAIILLRAGHTSDALARFADAREGLTAPDPVLEYFVSLAMDQSGRDAAGSGTTGMSAAVPPASSSPAVPASLPVVSRRKETASRKPPRRA